MRRVVWRTTANDLAHRTDFYRRALHQPTTREQTESAILPTTCAQALRYVWGNESNLSMLHTGITPASNLSVEFDRWRLPANTDVQSLFEAHFRRFTHRLHEAGRCASTAKQPGSRRRLMSVHAPPYWDTRANRKRKADYDTPSGARGEPNRVFDAHTGITPPSNRLRQVRTRLTGKSGVQCLFEVHCLRFLHRLHEAGRCAFRQNDQARGAWCSGQVPRLGKRYRPDLPCEIRRDVFARY